MITRRGSYTEWSNVPGTLTINVCWDAEANMLQDLDNDRFLVVDLPEEAQRADELVIEFTSNGYDDLGNLWGPPEECYPPGSADERIAVKAYLHIEDCGDGKPRIVPLDAGTVNTLDTIFCKQIAAEDLEFPKRA